MERIACRFAADTGYVMMFEVEDAYVGGCIGVIHGYLICFLSSLYDSVNRRGVVFLYSLH